MRGLLFCAGAGPRVCEAVAVAGAVGGGWWRRGRARQPLRKGWARRRIRPAALGGASGGQRGGGGEGGVLPVTPLPLGLSQAAGRHPLLQKAVSQETPGCAALPASVTEKGPERGHPW